MKKQLECCGRKLVEWERGVSKPAFEAMNKNPDKALSGGERGALRVDYSEEVVDPGVMGQIRAAEKMGSILVWSLTGWATMRVSSIITMHVFASGKEVVKKFDNKSFLAVAAPDDLAMADPVDQIEDGG